MTGIAQTINLTGMPALHASMERLADVGADMSPLMEAMGGAMADATVLRFETETEPDGTPWMPSWRARHEGGKTLSRTGRLKQSFDASRQGAVQAGPNTVEWGTNVAYAPPLQFGAVIYPKDSENLAFVGVEGHVIFAKNVVIPARPMVGISAADILTLQDIAAAYLDDVAGAP